MPTTDYLATLSPGEHTATMRSADGDASTTFVAQVATSDSSGNGMSSPYGRNEGVEVNATKSEPGEEDAESHDDSAASILAALSIFLCRRP